MADNLAAIQAALPHYIVGDEIGRGGWGIVVVATHRDLGRKVAVKQLPPTVGDDATMRERFYAEARVVASLDHPHIVPVFDFVDHEGLCLLVMEYMAGGTLWDRFRTEGLTTDQSCALMLAAAAALHHAHRQDVLHRDVKPENFLFNAQGTIKLADFGIAKLVNAGKSSYTLAGQVVGTPAYMAPEQATGGDVSPATDVYACGAMLYELLTGDLPFPETGEVLAQLFQRISRNPTPIAEIRADLPFPIGEVVMTALQREPEQRYPTAQAFGIALAKAATSAFGPGWLLRSGIAVLGAPEFVAATEQGGPGAAITATQPDRMRPSSGHAKLSEVIGGAGPTSLPGAPTSLPGTSLPGTSLPGTSLPGTSAAPTSWPPTSVPVSAHGGATTSLPPVTPAESVPASYSPQPYEQPQTTPPEADGYGRSGDLPQTYDQQRAAQEAAAPPSGPPSGQYPAGPPSGPYPAAPAPSAPVVGSPPPVGPPTDKPRRTGLLVVAALAAVVVIAAAVVMLLARSGNDVATGTSTSTTAGSSGPTTGQTTGPVGPTTGISTGPTTPVTGPPTILGLEPTADGNGLAVSWSDPDTTVLHVLDVRERTSEGDRTQRLALTANPQTITVGADAAVCVRLVVVTGGADQPRVASTTEPTCRNDGDPAGFS